MVHPSLSEGFSNALIEGQAAGLPIVCTDAGDSRDVIEDGVTGLVVPRRSPAALADAIAALAHNPERRRAFGAAGAIRARARFDIAGQMAAIEAMYTDLLARA